MSCEGSCNNGMTPRLIAGNAASGKENVMWRRLPSYYYIHMIPGGFMERFFDRFKYRRLKK